MSRLTNARNNYINKWVIPAASKLLVKAACKNARIRLLAEVAHVEMGQSPNGSSCNNNQEGIPFIGGPGDLGLIFPKITRWTNAPTKLCQLGDIIVCVRATIGEPRWADGVYCIGRGVAGIRPVDRGLDSRFLFHIIEANQQRLLEQGTGTTFKTISKRHLDAIPVPIIPKNEQESICNFLEWLEQSSPEQLNLSNAPLLPSHLEEQRRIVARVEELAGKVEEVRSLRQKALEEAEALRVSSAKAIFHELAQASTQPLRELVTVQGGGTPSKQNPFFWDGLIPWISPKDMKSREINNSIDHISEEATFKSSAKLLEPGSVLIVVRGMILAHTVPSAILRIPAAINQDMKALFPNEKITPEFLCCVFWTLNDSLLELVEKSTHDTRKLETPKLLNFKIPVPPLPEQYWIVAYLDKLQTKVDTMKHLREQAMTELDALLPSILDKAFKGEL